MRLIALLCALTILSAAILTGTYAWQSQQLALNHVYGTKDILVPVELVKLEKLADGTETETPIANTVFYLYRENGTQIGGRYVTDEEGKISILLAAGDYYFEEVSPSIGYTYDTDADGNPVTRYHFTVTEEDVTVTVLAYNRRLSGDLLIRKTVENTDGTPLTDEQKATPFEFTVTFSDGGTYAYRIDNGEALWLESGGTLWLCSGQTAVFEGLPVGVLYDVVETPVEGYITSSSGHRGNITADEASVAEFINRFGQYRPGSLTVTKEVQGEAADPDKEFTFIITLGDVAEEFTLKHGESKTFVGIPIGTQYTVTEQDPSAEGYIPTVREYSGQIVDGETVTLPFVNVFDPMPEGKVGSLTVHKTVTGENADPDREFTFEVIFEGENAPEDETFTLKAGESRTFENIPYGVTYTVTETDAAGCQPVLHTASGTIVGDHTAVVTFINIASDLPEGMVRLTIEKVLAGEYSEADAERLFHMTLIVNGEEFPFALKAGEIIEFIIPAGATYEVREEDYIGAGFSQSIINGAGTAVGELTEVTVINTYIGVPMVEISGSKTWDLNGHDDVALPESITVQLWNGDLLVEEKTVTPDEDGFWHYSFTAPKYNEDGSLAVYTVIELPVDGFLTSYDGYNITNTYVQPIVVDPPIITKVVEGEDAPETAFEFVFTGQHGTPMPEGSVGYRKTLTLTGAGEVEIGNITYDRAGTYVYTIHEKNGGEEGWSYDTALYTFTVVITETDGVLSAEKSLVKNGAAADELVFTNSFEEKQDETIILSGTKIWVHGNNPEADRPTSIIVMVYGDGQLVAQRQVTAEDNWQYSFELPRFAEDGHEIVYIIDEAEVEGYAKETNGYDIINTYMGGTDVPDPPVDPDPPIGPEPPYTGDDSNLSLWFTLIILSLIGLIVTALLSRRGAGKRCK